MALLNLENIAVLAISKEVVQGIGHGSPQVIIRLVFAQIISKITGSEVTPFAVITDESTGVKYPLADYETQESSIRSPTATAALTSISTAMNETTVRQNCFLNHLIDF